MKNAFKTAFIDTALFIYLLEAHPNFADPTERFLASCYARKVRLVTSVITHLEFSVKPYKDGRLDVIDDFQALLKDAAFVVATVGLPDCDVAARLRATHEGLKAFDALQIAVAMKERCEVFVCNDKRLKNIHEIDIMTLDDIM